jgi:hypothetical protein
MGSGGTAPLVLKLGSIPLNPKLNKLPVLYTFLKLSKIQSSYGIGDTENALRIFAGKPEGEETIS